MEDAEEEFRMAEENSPNKKAVIVFEVHFLRITASRLPSSLLMPADIKEVLAMKTAMPPKNRHVASKAEDDCILRFTR